MAVAPHATTVVCFLVEEVQGETELSADCSRVLTLAAKYSLDERVDFPVKPMNSIIVFSFYGLAEVGILRPE